MLPPGPAGQRLREQILSGRPHFSGSGGSGIGAVLGQGQFLGQRPAAAAAAAGLHRRAGLTKAIVFTQVRTASWACWSVQLSKDISKQGMRAGQTPAMPSPARP